MQTVSKPVLVYYCTRWKTNKLGIWFFQFLTNRTHYIILQGGLSQNSPVLSVPQGTVLVTLLLFIMVSDINKGITLSRLMIFSDDIRVYLNIIQVEDYDNLQSESYLQLGCTKQYVL